MSTTESTTTFVVLFSILPITLLVSSAIILDYALRYENFLNRCQIQIWMWLALALSSSRINDTTTDKAVYVAWGHLTLFFNLSAILVKALQTRLIILARSKQMFRIVVQVLPFSSWLSMIVAGSTIVITNTQQSAQPTALGLSLRTFLASFFALSFLRWYAHRKRKTSIDMQGMPTTTTMSSDSSDCCGFIIARLCGMAPPTAALTVGYNVSSSSAVALSSTAQLNAHSCWLDERRWYAWTRIQTMQWFAQQLLSSSSSSSSKGGDHRGIITDDDDDEGNDAILEILAPHRITGDVLDGLTDVSQLVALRVPFGPACRLADSVAQLITRYPKPGRRGGRAGAATRARTTGNHHQYCEDQSETASELRFSNDCLDLHDQEYNNPQRSRPVKDLRELLVDEGSQHPQRPGPSSAPGNQHQHQHHQYPHDPPDQVGITEEQHEKLNDVMKERFGLELPKLRGADFVEVQKGLWRQEQADNSNATISLSNTDRMPQLRPLDSSTASARSDDTGNGCTTGATVLPQQPYQDTPRLPASIENGTKPSASPFSSDSTNIPGTILDAMPPKIREIAKRRPDLMDTILKQQKQQPREQPQSRRPIHLHPLSDTIAEEEYSVMEGRGDNADGESDGDEMTSLIGRDVNEPPLQYRSIGKSRIEDIV